MYRKLLIALVATAAAAGPALAQDLTTPANPHLNLAGFSGDANALPNAVTAIESATGGRVVGIRYDNQGGAPGYDVVLAQGGQVSFERASETGEVIATTAPNEAVETLGWANRQTVNDILAAKVPLADAIRTAEARRWGAPAVAAGLDPSSIQPNVDVKAYNVAVLQDGAQRRVAVDSETGMAIVDPRAMNAFT